MSNASLELGGGKWAAKEGNLLGYASSTSSSKFVPREFTFTRGSDIAATRINSSGLIEKYRENLLLQSNQFDTTWTLNSTSVTSGQSGYDGSSDAWLLNSTTTGFPRIEQLVSASGVSTFSVYAKPATDGFALIRTFGAEATAWFDLINGTITNASGAQYVSSKIQFVGNGWYRCSVTFNGSLTTARIYPASAYGTYSTSGNGVYIQDTQIEKGLVATSYLESGATTATSGVADNEPRIDYAGGTASLLLEPSRTNEIAQSEYFDSWVKVGSPTITNNYGISPEGVQNSTRFEAISDRITNNVSTINANETFSIYMKGSGTLLIQLGGVDNFYTSVTSEWVRYEFTTTQAGVNGSVQIRGNGSAVDVELYGAQYERNSYPTSYIPTYGTSVTRVQDFNHYEDIIANPIVFGANDDFTLYYEGSFDELGNNMIMGGGNSGISDGSGRSYWWVRNTNMFLRGAGEIAIASVAFTPAKNTNYKLLVKRNGSQVDFYVDGTKIPTTQQTTNTSFTLRSVGWSYNKNTYVAKGNIKQVKVFPTALSDAECITLTT